MLQDLVTDSVNIDRLKQVTQSLFTERCYGPTLEDYDDPKFAEFKDSIAESMKRDSLAYLKPGGSHASRGASSVLFNDRGLGREDLVDAISSKSRLEEGALATAAIFGLVESRDSA